MRLRTGRSPTEQQLRDCRRLADSRAANSANDEAAVLFVDYDDAAAIRHCQPRLGDPGHPRDDAGRQVGFHQRKVLTVPLPELFADSANFCPYDPRSRRGSRQPGLT